MQALHAGPEIIAVKERGEIGNNIRTLHIACNQRNERHFIMFRVNRFQGRSIIDVLRLLHYTMELARHPPAKQRSRQRSLTQLPQAFSFKAKRKTQK